MTKYSEDTTDVVVLVLRNRAEDGNYYLLAKDRGNDFWEFIGGKIKKGEPLKEAVFRELNDEIELDCERDDMEIVRTGESFESPENPVFDLHPVLVEIPGNIAWDLGDKDLSREHTSLEWIRLEEIDSYETLGEKKALEKLGILN